MLLTVHPGTTKDIDFYFAPGDPRDRGAPLYPPQSGWKVIPQRGASPEPRVEPLSPGERNDDDQTDYI